MGELEKLDILENKPSWGGPRPNSGRPRGKMNEATKERVAVKKALQERIANVADNLFNSQYNLATGEQYLFWKHKVGSGAKERTVTEVVTDIDVIKDYLDEALDTSNGDFYYISTKPANGMAIDSMFDRAFGKADAKLDLTSNGETLGGVSPEQSEQLLRIRAKRTNS